MSDDRRNKKKYLPCSTTYSDIIVVTISDIMICLAITDDDIECFEMYFQQGNIFHIVGHIPLDVNDKKNLYVLSRL